MGVLRQLNNQGDTTLTWNPVNEEATKIAEKKFNELRGAGNLIYETKGGVGQSQVMAFDPNAEELIAVGAIQGG